MSKPAKVKEYYGYLITRNQRSGSYIRWQSYTGTRFLYADTLEGIKELIRKDRGSK